ncbi:MAG TPA: flagellin lysine-N-methylase [Myxococcota bacterium]|nr:flagellin lysine-N-methylase [Myxococcota bacterium]
MNDDGEKSLTMRYMNRFGCIGAACEENCCMDGWRIDVNKAHYEKLMAMAQFSAKPIARKFNSTFIIVPKKNKKDPERYIIKQFEGGGCSLFDDGWCELHATFGYESLPHVCAFYPRKLKYVGDTIELTATGSCPEVTRQIILHEDGVELEPIDFGRVHRKVLQDGIDPRDTRPFFRTFIEVRQFVLDLLRDGSLRWDHRQFLLLWFAKRTTEVLSKSVAKGDTDLIEREFTLLKNPKVRHEILKRYESLETPAALVLMVVRAIVRPKTRGIVRPKWNELVNGVINSYQRLAEVLPASEDPDEHDRLADQAAQLGTSAPTYMTTIEVWQEYLKRRNRLRQHPKVRDRIDGMFRNYTMHTWFHRMPTEEKDILTYTLRVLTQQAAMKFLLYSQLPLQAALDALEQVPEGDSEAREAAEKHLMEEVERQTVSVFYQIARHVEHGLLIKWLTEMLRKMDLFSAAGGVFLIHF